MVHHGASGACESVQCTLCILKQCLKKLLPGGIMVVSIYTLTLKHLGKQSLQAC